MSTTISKQTNDRIRTTLPKAIVDETGFHDLENQQIQYQIQCGRETIDLIVQFGPGIDQDGRRTTTPLVFDSTGQVQLELPVFMASAWRLVDCSVLWEDGSIEAADDGTVTITAPIGDWEPPTDVDFYELVQSESKAASLTKSGHEVENIYAMLPTEYVRQLGIETGDANPRVEPGFTYFQGRPVVVLEPTDATREEKAHSRAVTFAGPDNSQPRIGATEIAVELGIDDRVGDLEYGESIRLQWVLKDGEFLLGFVGDTGA